MPKIQSSIRQPGILHRTFPEYVVFCRMNWPIGIRCGMVVLKMRGIFSSIRRVRESQLSCVTDASKVNSYPSSRCCCCGVRTLESLSGHAARQPAAQHPILKADSTKEKQRCHSACRDRVDGARFRRKTF